MFENVPASESNPFLNQQGVEQPFSKEGVLNRNFGKDATIPSEVDVYANGVLNRAKMYRERGGVQPDTNIDSSESVGTSTEAEPSVEVPVIEEEAQVAEGRTEAPLIKEKKPLMADLVDVYRSLDIQDPEKAAFDALFERLEPNLSDEEKLEKMRGITDEYRKHLGEQQEK